MVRKLLLIFGVVLLVACARNATEIASTANDEEEVITSVETTTYSVVWQNPAGTAMASNVVQGKLPVVGSLGSSAVSSTHAGHFTYSSPLIFKDSNNVQYVVALWASATGLHISKYTYADSVLTLDTSFGTNGSVSMTPDSTGYKAHQIAISSESDVPYIYVTHGSGISKYNAVTGAVVGDGYGSDGAMFRLLINGTDLYVQSKTKVVKLSTDLVAQKSSAAVSTITPLRQLPLVLSNDSIYVVFDNLYKYNATTLDLEATDTISSGQTVTSIAGFDTSVIYSLVSLSEKIISGKTRKFSTTAFKVFGTTDFNTVDGKYKTYSENREHALWGSFIGDYSFTPLAVSGTSVYMPSVSYTMFRSGATPNIGVSVLKTADTPTVNAIYSSDPQKLATNSFGHFCNVARFIVVDETSGQIFSISNLNESLFTSTGAFESFTQHTDAQPLIGDDSTANGGTGWSFIVSGVDADKITNYNSTIIYGTTASSSSTAFSSPSLAILSIGVGDKLIIMSGNDGKLYTFQ